MHEVRFIWTCEYHQTVPTWTTRRLVGFQAVYSIVCLTWCIDSQEHVPSLRILARHPVHTTYHSVSKGHVPVHMRMLVFISYDFQYGASQDAGLPGAHAGTGGVESGVLDLKGGQ